jgi:hypothetical protein
VNTFVLFGFGGTGSQFVLLGLLSGIPLSVTGGGAVTGGVWIPGAVAGGVLPE